MAQFAVATALVLVTGASDGSKPVSLKDATRSDNATARIVFVTFGAHGAEIDTIRSDGSDRARLASLGRVDGIAWSPSGSWIAFTRGRHLYVIKRTGRDRKLISSDVLPSSGDVPWSRLFSLSNRIAVAFVSGRKRGSDISTVGAAAAVTKITHTSVPEVEPSWSPDGSQIAFVGYRGPFRIGVYLVGAQGGQPRLVPGSAGGEPPENPTWSPDGRSLAFGYAGSDDGSGLSFVTVGGAKGNQIRTGFNELRSVDAIAWSPDGTHIAIGDELDQPGNDSSRPQGVLVVADLQDHDRHMIPTLGHADGLAWSPDGTKIAALNCDDYAKRPSCALFIVNADGSHTVRIALPYASSLPSNGAVAWASG